MTFPTLLPPREEVDPEVRLIVPALVDLHQPKKTRYWSEFLISAALGWGLLFLGAKSTSGCVSIVALGLAVGALYRAVQFIHELEHLRPGAIPGLGLAWSLCIGIPFLLPRFLHGAHHAHHDGRTYGTRRDPEYSPTFGSSRKSQVAFVGVATLAPLLLALRALILTPVSLLVPSLRRWLLTHASTLGMNLTYERLDLACGDGPPGWQFEELLVSLSAWCWLSFTIAGRMEAQTLALGLCVMAGVAVLDQLKTLCVHRFIGGATRLSHGQQAVDAIDVGGRWLAEIWAPLNGRFHALHHLVPALPYHALPEAHRRLARLLPSDAWLRRAEEASVARALAWLRGPGVDVPSAEDTRCPGYRSPGILGRSLGCVPELVRDFRSTLIHAAEAHGPVCELVVPGRRIFALHDPAAAQAMLSTERSAFSKETPGFHAMRAVLGRGLITADGPEWLDHRRRVQAGFKPDMLAVLERKIERTVRDQVGCWGTSGPFDLAEACFQLTLNVTASTLFSIDLGNHRALGHDLRTVTSQSESRLLTTAGAWLPTAKNRKWKTALRRLDLFLFDLIAERQLECAKRGSSVTSQREQDLLDVLLRAYPDDPGQVRDEAMTFLLAGQETTAMGALWTFVLMCRFPEADTTNDRRTVLEALRLMPPVWLLGRRAERPVEVCGQHIPSGAFVLVSPWILHRRSDLYPEPDRFDPTRFAACPPKYGYVPFGAGPRRCIGDDLSLQILERVLSVTRERGRIDVQDPWDISEAAGITVRPRGPVTARWLTPQDKRVLSVIDSPALAIERAS